MVKEINLCLYTKGDVLCRIATLFDALQFLAPYIIGAKIALQEAWLRCVVLNDMSNFLKI